MLKKYFKKLFKNKSKVNYKAPKSQRYYYPQKQLLGEECKTNIINAQEIIKLCEKADIARNLRHKCFAYNTNDKVEQIIPLKNYSNGLNIFNVANAIKEDIEYSSKSEGVEYCYLPTKIDFWDEDGSVTYFVAVVENKCEIRSNSQILVSLDQVKNGTNFCTWYQSIGKYPEVKEEKIIKKIENTILAYNGRLNAMIVEYNRIIEEKEKVKQEIISKNQILFATIEKKLEHALSLIGVSKRTYQNIYHEALKSKYLIDTILESLSDKNSLAYLDWKLNVEDVLFNLNNVAKKQNLKIISEDTIDINCELCCDEAVNYIQQKVDIYSYFLIDIGSDGCFAGIVSTDKLELFVSMIDEIFSQLEDDTYKITKA